MQAEIKGYDWLLRTLYVVLEDETLDCRHVEKAAKRDGREGGGARPWSRDNSRRARAFAVHGVGRSVSNGKGKWEPSSRMGSVMAKSGVR